MTHKLGSCLACPSVRDNRAKRWWTALFADLKDLFLVLAWNSTGLCGLQCKSQTCWTTSLCGISLKILCTTLSSILGGVSQVFWGVVICVPPRLHDQCITQIPDAYIREHGVPDQDCHRKPLIALPDGSMLFVRHRKVAHARSREGAMLVPPLSLKCIQASNCLLSSSLAEWDPSLCDFSSRLPESFSSWTSLPMAKIASSSMKAWWQWEDKSLLDLHTTIAMDGWFLVVHQSWLNMERCFWPPLTRQGISKNGALGF